MDMTALQARGEAMLDQLMAWATSPSGWVQAILVVVAIVLAPVLAKMVKTRVAWLRDAPGPDAVFRGIVYKVAPFLRALIQVGLLMVAAAVADAAFENSALVRLALGFALVFLIYRMIRTLLPKSVQKAALLIVIPLAVLGVIGVLDDITSWLDATYAFDFLGTTFTPTKILRVVVLGALLFWLGGVFNNRGQSAIRGQENLDIGVREIMAKLFQILLFFVLGIMLLSVASIPLSGLVVIVSALGLGIGLGLQSVAANFVSGLIILLDRSVRIGDFVEMDDGMMGTVSSINMRSTTLETADGKDVLIPNLNFIESRYLNWTHTDPTQRYEVEFTVHYDTDLDSLEDIIIPEILKYEKLDTSVEPPDLELRSFGEHGIRMAIEFWAVGIDDGENKFTSDIGMIIWRTLKAAGVVMPYHQIVMHKAK
jgi:small-conductance mechanosensitive channel